jgi:hypothetical protein
MSASVRYRRDGQLPDHEQNGPGNKCAIPRIDKLTDQSPGEAN